MLGQCCPLVSTGSCVLRSPKVGAPGPTLAAPSSFYSEKWVGHELGTVTCPFP